jgi:ribosomal protein S18 acetylase RimI-like enzyme
VIAIRPATAEDAAAIAAVHVQSHRETYPAVFGADYIGPPLAERLALWGRVLPAGAFVATDEGRVVGFGHAHDGRITTLYILASHHRRGIGRQLLQALLGHLQGAGVREAHFEVLAGNDTAIRFYETHGARCVGRRPIEPGSKHDDLLYVIATR